MRTRQPIIFQLAVFLGCLSIAGGVSWAQEPAGLNLVYGYQAYNYSDSTSLFELDYQFSERGLAYVEKGKEKIGSLYLRFTLIDAQGRPAMQTDWVTTNPAPADDQAPRELLGVKYFEVRPGTYKAQLYYEDLGNPAHRDSTSFTLTVRSFSDDKLALSDIEMISEDVNASDETSHPFYKNGWMVIPNPAGQIVPPFLLLTTYLEIYNTDRIATSEFALTYSLADSIGRIFYKQEKKVKRPLGKSTFDINRIDVTELPSGTYYLLVTAIGGLRVAATDSAMVLKPVTISNPEKDQQVASSRAAIASDAPASDVIDPIYAGRKEEELNEEFEKVRYVAQNAEIDVFEKLQGAEAKGRFLTYFWNRRDPSPGTVINEYRDDYFARVEVARTAYRAPRARKGWDSDRGRILLQYGKPDGIDRHHHDYNRKPYEIWTYVTNDVRFVFVDRGNTGTFNLVHSQNAPSEPRDENWVSNYAVEDRNFDVQR